jgi:hypothetical protein
VKQSVIKDNKVKFENKVQFLETVDENKKFYTKRQFEQAKQAHELLYSLRYPSINDMKTIIWMNTIKNNPVTVLQKMSIFQKIVLDQMLLPYKERQLAVL